MRTYVHFIRVAYNHRTHRKFVLWQRGDYHYEIEEYCLARGIFLNKIHLHNTKFEEAYDYLDSLTKEVA